MLAVEHVRRMKGGSQSQLMRCDDDAYYIVKFQNNPQHLRILANEMLATRLAAHLGISVPHPAIIEVHEDLIKFTADLVIQLGIGRIACSAGKQFGSRFAGDPSHVRIHQDLDDQDLGHVRNIKHFLGIFIFDKWTCNTDGRQVIFVPKPNLVIPNRPSYQAMMIDFGSCFNSGEWDFPDSPLRGMYARTCVYYGVTGMESFEPWLDRLETVTKALLEEEARRIPTEWYCDDWRAMKRLIEQLYTRRTRVRELVLSTLNSNRNPFPNWKHQSPCPPRHVWSGLWRAS